MDYLEIINKLIGPIRPIGESQADSERYENMVTRINLTHELVDSIAVVAKNSTHYEGSRIKAGERAIQFMRDLHEGLSAELAKYDTKETP